MILIVANTKSFHADPIYPQEAQKKHINFCASIYQDSLILLKLLPSWSWFYFSIPFILFYFTTLLW